MTPVNSVFDQATDFHALREAARRAARGTRSRESAVFLCDLESHVLALQGQLRAGSYQPGPFRTFHIVDPKPRTISAAPFRDRVVHHALCAAMEPTFERYAVFDSYACRKGKGNLAAVHRVQALSRRHAWFAKLDVLHCFETVDLDVLLAMLRRRFGEHRLMALCETILRAGAGPDGRGLPIGNLTSQHFANFLLGVVDHFAQEQLRVGGWVRYMDDMVVLGADKDRVRDRADAVAAFLGDVLHQQEKTAARRLAPVHTGLPFLGFRIWPQRVRLDRARRRRLARRLRSLDRGLAAGHISPADAQQRGAAVTAWAEQGDTLGLRRSLLWG